MNILDVMAKIEFKTVWYENNSYSYDIANRHKYYELEPKKDLDENFLNPLKLEINGSSDNIFIVLHTIGSHGPAYHRRSSESVKKFFPECKYDDIKRCTNEEIVNAYDNSILYTDHFLGSLIDMLNDHRHDAALLYVSDHGESLGEYGVYLHGFPYMIAPSEQTHIPFILWMNDSFIKNNKIDMQKLKKKEMEYVSHDNIFHTTLGLLGVKSKFLNNELDLIGRSSR